MKHFRIVLFLLAVCLLAPVLASATPTPTVTPTATPSPKPTAVVPKAGGVTHFHWVGTNPGSIYGGRTVRLTATAALLVGQCVKPDTANADSVVVCVAGDTTPIGIVVGTKLGDEYMGQSPLAGQTAIIQVNGIVQAISEGSINKGVAVMVGGTTIAGSVTTYSAGTVDEQLGVSLTSTTAAGQAIDILLYK